MHFSPRIQSDARQSQIQARPRIYPSGSWFFFSNQCVLSVILPIGLRIFFQLGIVHLLLLIHCTEFRYSIQHSVLAFSIRDQVYIERDSTCINDVCRIYHTVLTMKTLICRFCANWMPTIYPRGLIYLFSFFIFAYLCSSEGPKTFGKFHLGMHRVYLKYAFGVPISSLKIDILLLIFYICRCWRWTPNQILSCSSSVAKFRACFKCSYANTGCCTAGNIKVNKNSDTLFILLSACCIIRMKVEFHS